jgi:hypothetical protein
LKRCTLFLLLILLGCTQKKKIEVQRSFYYWKSILSLSHRQQAVLDSFSVQKLYIKFFDVDWDNSSHTALPISKIQFKDALPAGINCIPVVFITNETLQHSHQEQIDSLGKKIIQLVENIATINHLKLFPELQIDCDWTTGTRDSYFQLLKAIRQQPFLRNKELSATIRLHQLKFIRQAGLPPVDKGLLMCYNMGNLYNSQVNNSILDVEELKKYIGSLQEYPLKLDIALPIFDWYVWFRNNRFKGLIGSGNLDEKFSKTEKTIFEKDSTVNGYTFEQGDWLRYEYCDAQSLKETARLIRERLRYDKITVVLYHLDDYHLSKYSIHEMEAIFNRFY